jgi:phosphotransferase family enzyme
VNAIDELLAEATERTPLVAGDGKSGAPIERVVIRGNPYIAKHMEVGGDWLARATGDLGLRQLLLWERGMYQRVPSCIDPVVVGVARDGRRGVLLMNDVGAQLVPEGDDPIPLEQHLRFLDHLAALHAAFWGWEDDIGLATDGIRFAMFGPGVVRVEADRGTDSPIPALIGKGLELLRASNTRGAAIARTLLDDPDPLLVALARTPQTFLHGDTKMGNLGSHPDGRTIAIDWEYAGPGEPASEITWYLAINSARLPQTKEATIATYRAALERQGIDTEPWWDAQIALALLGAFVQFGWEKALGGGDELAWWEARAAEAERYLA